MRKTCVVELSSIPIIHCARGRGQWRLKCVLNIYVRHQGLGHLFGTFGFSVVIYVFKTEWVVTPVHRLQDKRESNQAQNQRKRTEQVQQVGMLRFSASSQGIWSCYYCLIFIFLRHVTFNGKRFGWRKETWRKVWRKETWNLLFELRFLEFKK